MVHSGQLCRVSMETTLRQVIRLTLGIGQCTCMKCQSTDAVLTGWCKRPNEDYAKINLINYPHGMTTVWFWCMGGPVHNYPLVFIWSYPFSAKVVLGPCTEHLAAWKWLGTIIMTWNQPGTSLELEMSWNQLGNTNYGLEPAWKYDLEPAWKWLGTSLEMTWNQLGNMAWNQLGTR